MAYLSTYDEKSTGFYSSSSSSYSDAPASILTNFTIAEDSSAYGLLQPINYIADSDFYAMGVLEKGTYEVSANNYYWFFGSGYNNPATPNIKVYDSLGRIVAGDYFSSETFIVTSPQKYYIEVEGSGFIASQYAVSYSYTPPTNYAPNDVALSIIGNLTIGSQLSLDGTFSDANGLSNANSNGGYYFTWYTSSDNINWAEVGNGSTYLITGSDQGKYIDALITFIDDMDFSEVVSPVGVFIPNASDTTSPTVALNSSATNLSGSQTASITFTLNESSTNFTASDVTVTGGTLSNFSGSGTTYTALFTPTANSTTNGVVRVASGVFTDAAGNANADGSDTNNTVTMTVNTVPVAITQTNTLSVIVDKGVLGSDAVLLKDLKEVTTTLDGIVQSHTVEYQGAVFGFAAIDSLIMAVTRDGEFTQEFRAEIAQAYPGVENILYADAVSIVGVANIDQILVGVAGFDGDFVN